jgi:hypothetical protein
MKLTSCKCKCKFICTHIFRCQRRLWRLVVGRRLSQSWANAASWTMAGPLRRGRRLEHLLRGRWLGTRVLAGGWGTSFVDSDSTATSTAAVPQALFTAAGRPGALGSSMHFRPRRPTDSEKPVACGVEGVEAWMIGRGGADAERAVLWGVEQKVWRRG